MTAKGNGYREAFGDNDESLAIFLRAMRRFDRDFCEAMASGVDFTLRLEIRGDQGRMIHARVNADGFERPKSVDREAERKHRGLGD